jgi:hypothetical protein
MINYLKVIITGLVQSFSLLAKQVINTDNYVYPW